MTLKCFSSLYLCNGTMLGFLLSDQKQLLKAMQESNLGSQGKAEKAFCPCL